MPLLLAKLVPVVMAVSAFATVFFLAGCRAGGLVHRRCCDRSCIGGQSRPGKSNTTKGQYGAREQRGGQSFVLKLFHFLSFLEHQWLTGNPSVRDKLFRSCFNPAAILSVRFNAAPS